MEQSITRRGFLGTAGVAGVAMATCAAPFAHADEAAPAAGYTYAKTPDDVAGFTQIETDVFVIGGGGAGICAALAAAENGANVVLAEKSGILGGATTLSGGKIPAVGTKQQVDLGEEDSVGACAMDIFRPNNYSVREDLVYTVAEKGKDMIEWTEGFGVVWTIMDSLYYGQTAYRMHNADGNGAGLTEKLIAAMEANSAITTMMNCEVKGLIVDGDTVVGGYGTDESGADVAIVAKNTVLASSGFGNNPDMLAQYCPEAVPAVKIVAPGATGEGILWGAELGAELQNMGSWQGYAFHDVDNDGTVEQTLLDNGGIFVNPEGNRFCNEYDGYSELTPHILAQTDHIAYLCFTDIQVEQSAGFAGWQEEGIVYQGDTAEDLAAAIGVDPAKLAKTFADYQAGIENGLDKFNRCKFPANFDGPYYALKVTGEIRHTQGGIVTDVACHALRADKSLIKGLYAAGGCTEGFSSRGGAAYMSGNGLIQALVFGKIAGEKAATEDPASAELAVWEKSEIDAYL